MIARLEGRPNHYDQFISTLGTYIIMGPVIGVITGRPICWYEFKVEESLSTLTETSIPVDHCKRSQTERTDPDPAIKVDIGSRSIRV